VIRSVATSILRDPTTTRSAFAVEPGAHQLDHLRNREAVRAHDRFRAALAPAAREQLERASAIGLGTAMGAALTYSHHH
jgi:hypothetical protein